MELLENKKKLVKGPPQKSRQKTMFSPLHFLFPLILAEVETIFTRKGKCKRKRKRERNGKGEPKTKTKSKT